MWNTSTQLRDEIDFSLTPQRDEPDPGKMTYYVTHRLYHI